MILKIKNLRNRIGIKRIHLTAAIFAVMILLIPSTTFGILNLWDAPQGLPDIDNRAGLVLPTAAQLSRVQSLGARADWNNFGTINTLIKDGGYISTGFSGEPAAAAREWVRVNRDLFKLSEQGVADLVLINDGKMPYNDAHFILFRQSFGGVVPTQDGQINVSIVNGNIFHVWASSAGDRAAPGPATITPLQGWLAAANNVNRAVPLTDILNVAADASNNWTLINIQGFPQVQQVRLSAIPTPLGGVRPAYEANVVYNVGHINEAYTVFVDAQSGNILKRTNRVSYLNAPPPQTTTFQGEYQPRVYPCGGTVHNFTVPAGKTRIAVQATAAVAVNDIKVHLLFNNVEVASEDTGISSEALNYAPTGGVPAGMYTVAVCQTTNTMGVPQSAPYSYVGNFVTDDTNTPSAAIPSPRWRYHPAYPDLDFLNTDARRIFGCWQITPGGTLPAACGRDERNVAARAPWDYDFNAGTFTGTTRGNAAQTAESWGSPLTPSTPYAPTSATRDYNFRWTNHWNRTKCDPTILVHTGTSGSNVQDDADIDASIVQLFVVHNRFHDWGYNLGFTETNYNLQLDNFGNTDASRENDPEIGNVQAGAVSGGANGMYMGRDNANQIALQDGVPGITNQYLFQPIAGAFYAPCTDGDNDVGIVGHEYTHAISGRMVGGPDDGLTGAQAGAMNESWSDLDAAEFENAFNYVPQQGENKTAVGIYATNNRKLAIRDYNLEDNPLNYSNIGFDTPGPEVHADGEIWNAVNWNIRQVLIDKYNSQYPYSDLAARQLCGEGKKNPADCAGNRRWIQIMFDAYLLQAGATSMLNARDAYLSADMARFNGANQTELWSVFARRGFGILANSNGTADTTPIPDFSSPIANNATVTFNVLGGDEGNQAIAAKVFVGLYEGRSRPIADTDPATAVTTDPRSNINDNVAKFVAGTYDFVVQAPGYGSHRFTRTFIAGETATITFTLPTNRASVTKGATITTTATDAADQTAKTNLIDDTEGTGARLGTTTTPADDSMTVDLQGTAPVNVTSINISTAAGPNNPGRFTGIRKFAIDASTNGLTFTTVYTSPDDAFPAEVPRPVQPQLIMRNFAIPATMATHLRLRVLKTQCTGKAEFLGEQDNDPFNNTDCASYVPPISPGPPPTTPIAPGAISRATEFQVFTSAPTISSPAGLEGDVSPRSTSDGFVDADDIQQIRRFGVGLDQPFQGNDFQRADDSPRSTAGDGVIDADDVQQARRYAVGTDSQQFASGPSAPGSFAPVSVNDSLLSAKGKASVRSNNRTVAAPAAFRVDAQNTNAGSTLVVPIRVDTVGNEAGYTFSIAYDSTKLTNPMVAIGNGGGNVVFNANNPGQIGFSVTSFSGGTIAAGNNIALVNVTFTVAANAPSGTTPITFTDTPAPRKVSGVDPNTPITQPTYTNGTITISGATTAAFRINNQSTNAGQTLVVPIRVDTVGNEAGYTFSISYDSTKLTNPMVAIGNGGGNVVFNANNPGQIGFSVTSFSGGTIAAGNNIALVNVTFTVAANAPSGTTPITFTDTPAPRKVSGVDPNTPITQPTYTNGTISIGGVAAASAAFRVDNQNTSAGRTLIVPIRVDTLGNEAGYTFSISYDSTKLTNPMVAIGSDGGDVVFNANNPGQIGFSVTSFSGGTIAAGSNTILVNVTFTVATNAQPGMTPITFTDAPARRKASGVDPNTPITQPTYTNGTITIGGATAAGATISGRALTSNGRGITNVVISLTDSQGNSRMARTTSFGYFEFRDVPTGDSYIIEAKAKRFKFGQPTQVRNVSGDTNDVIFVADGF